MQELKFRNFLSSFFVFIIAVAASIGSSYINIRAFDLPIPLLTIGLFAGFLILGFVCYPKATTGQTIQITIAGVFINAMVIIAAFFGIKYLGISQFTISPNFIISANPLTSAASFLFSFITLISTVRFQNKTDNKAEIIPEKQPVKSEENITPELIPFAAQNTTPEIIEKVELKVEKTESLPKSTYEELYPQAKIEVPKNPEPEQEFFLNLKEEKPAEIKQETKNKDKNEEFIELGELPSLVFEETPVEKKAPESKSEINEEEYFDFIPTDIRLVDAPVSKDSESKGKIAAIGKLLVNNRDIEGVLESNALTETGTDSKTGVISSASGEQIYEKFNMLKQEFTQIKEIALIDKGGFILASNFEDMMKIHITGALIAGAYHTLANYLAQISFKFPQKIFFETEGSNNFIIKTGDELLFSIWDKEFKHVDFGELADFIEENEISAVALTPLVELGQIQNFTISDTEGQIINSAENTESSQKQGIISAALFENLKVFLTNIQLVKLRRITIFNPEEILVVQKFDNGIASFRIPIDGLVKISDNFIRVEEIY